MAADPGDDQPPAASSLEAATAADLTSEFEPICGGCGSSQLRVDTPLGGLPSGAKGCIRDKIAAKLFGNSSYLHAKL